MQSSNQTEIQSNIHSESRWLLCNGFEEILHSKKLRWFKSGRPVASRARSKTFLKFKVDLNTEFLLMWTTETYNGPCTKLLRRTCSAEQFSSNQCQILETIYVYR